MEHPWNFRPTQGGFARPRFPPSNPGWDVHPHQGFGFQNPQQYIFQRSFLDPPLGHPRPHGSPEFYPRGPSFQHGLEFRQAAEGMSRPEIEFRANHSAGGYLPGQGHWDNFRPQGDSSSWNSFVGPNSNKRLERFVNPNDGSGNHPGSVTFSSASVDRRSEQMQTGTNGSESLFGYSSFHEGSFDYRMEHLPNRSFDRVEQHLVDNEIVHKRAKLDNNHVVGNGQCGYPGKRSIEEERISNLIRDHGGYNGPNVQTPFPGRPNSHYLQSSPLGSATFRVRPHLAGHAIPERGFMYNQEQYPHENAKLSSGNDGYSSGPSMRNQDFLDKSCGNLPRNMNYREQGNWSKPDPHVPQHAADQDRLSTASSIHQFPSSINSDYAIHPYPQPGEGSREQHLYNLAGMPSESQRQHGPENVGTPLQNNQQNVDKRQQNYSSPDMDLSAHLTNHHQMLQPPLVGLQGHLIPKSVPGDASQAFGAPSLASHVHSMTGKSLPPSLPLPPPPPPPPHTSSHDNQAKPTTLVPTTKYMGLPNTSVALSSSLMVPGHGIPEAQPPVQGCYLNQSAVHTATKFLPEGLPETESKHYADGQLFSAHKPVIDKLKVVDATHIFMLPHRATRPDHIVIILRGLPGSGKSYMAKALRDLEVSNGGNAPRIHSMDDYFITEVEKVEENDSSMSCVSSKGRRMLTKKVMEYRYEPEMEEVYRASMLKAFKKTIEDGIFKFVIVDDRNLRVADFAQFWAIAKRSGYEVYILEAAYRDIAGCAARNVHGFTSEDIQKMAEKWEQAPPLYLQLDTQLLFCGDNLNNQDIAEVEMDMEDMDCNTEESLREHYVNTANKLDMPSPKSEYEGDQSGTGEKWKCGISDSLEEAKDIGRSKWFDKTDEVADAVKSPKRASVTALNGLLQAYGKGDKSVHWGDRRGSGFAIGVGKKCNSLIIGPGAGYNLDSNPLPEEEANSHSVPAGSKSHSVFLERLRAEHESFRAVFDCRRQQIGGLDVDDE